MVGLQLLNVLVLSTVCCQQTLGNGDSLPWPNAATVIRTVCPFEHICEIPHFYTGIRTSCCSACSCSEDCHLEGRCCFLNNDKVEEETCMFPRSKYSQQYVRSVSESLTQTYYIVTERPAAGCVRGTRDTCKTDETSSMAPVYSKDRNKIYINSACAKCHGVDDVIEWETMFVCDGLGSSSPVDFEKEVTKYLRDRTSSSCFLTYQLFGKTHVNTRKCVIDDDVERIIGNGEDILEKPLDPAVNMTIETVLEACKSNFYAPMKYEKKWYPNPFCFLYAERKLHSPVCLSQSENVLALDYLTLLNPSVEALFKSTEDAPSNDMEIACLAESTEGHLCRPVLCPFGHVRDLEGKCTFFGTTIYFRSRRNISIHILLKRNTSTPGIPSSNLTLTLEDVTNALQLPAGCTVDMYATPSDVKDNTTNRLDELLVRIQPTTMTVIEFLQALKEHLSKAIVLEHALGNVTFTQHIYPLRLPFARTTELYEAPAYCTNDAHAVLNRADQTTSDELKTNVRGEDSGPVANANDDLLGPAFTDSDIPSGHDTDDLASMNDINDNGKDDGRVFGLVGSPSLMNSGTDAVQEVDTDRQDVDGETDRGDQDERSSIDTDDQDAVPLSETNDNDDTDKQSNLSDATTKQPYQALCSVLTGTDHTHDRGIIGDGSVTDRGNRSHDITSLFDITAARYLPTCWNVIYASFRLNDHLAVDITKLYLCETIELLPGEFLLKANNSVLYYKTRRIYLYAKEFILIDNDDGNKTAKICLEDSAFVKTVVNGSVKFRSFVATLVIILCQLIIQLGFCNSLA